MIRSAVRRRLHILSLVLCTIVLASTARLASAEIVPFMTDAEVDLYLDDLTARVHSPGGAVQVWEPGIQEVRAGGKALKVLGRAPNLLTVDMPKGLILVEVKATGAPQIPTPSASPSAGTVGTREKFIERAKSLKPGDEIVIRNGAYPSWHVEVAAKGTAEKPIVVRPETPGGVLFYHGGETAGDSYSFRAGLRITGEHIVVKHLRFSHTRRFTVQLEGANDNRLTQCHFRRCGSAVSTFGHVLNVGKRSNRNRVDHCYFTGSKSMSLGQSIPREQAECGQGNRFDHNFFRDIERVWLNGQEAVQIGGGSTPLTVANCTVEYNLFDNCSGDLEIISNKSSGNHLNHNLFAQCKGTLYFRNGNHGEAVGNVLLGTVNGLSVRGTGHRIANNLIVRPRDAGILLNGGSAKQPERNGPATKCLIAHNTIVEPGTSGMVGGLTPKSEKTLPPSDNRIVNNVVTARTGTVLNIGNPDQNTIEGNLVWAAGEAKPGAAGKNTANADPKIQGDGIETRPAANGPAAGAAKTLDDVPLDRWQRKRPKPKTDLGADILAQAPDTDPMKRLLPRVPPQAHVAVEPMAGSPLYEMSADAPLEGWKIEGKASPTDGGFLLGDASVAHLSTEMPADFVLDWEYRPELFASETTLVLLARKGGPAYRLGFGGARDQKGRSDGKMYEGIPAGVVRLRKGAPGPLVATAMDTLYTFMNFYPTWPGNTIKLRHKTPPRDWWYQCRLTRKNGLLTLTMNNLNATSDGHWIPKSKVRRSYPVAAHTPVLIWEDTGEIGGAPLGGGALRIEQSLGGTWRKVRLWKHR